MISAAVLPVSVPRYFGRFIIGPMCLRPLHTPMNDTWCHNTAIVIHPPIPWSYITKVNIYIHVFSIKGYHVSHHYAISLNVLEGPVSYSDG